MDTHRAIDIVVALAQVFYRLGVVGTDSDTQEMTDTAGAGGIQSNIEGALVSGEVEAIKVAMGIYKHG